MREHYVKQDDEGALCVLQDTFKLHHLLPVNTCMCMAMLQPAVTTHVNYT